jgi:hypothetical protein
LQEKTLLTSGTTANLHATVTTANATLGNNTIQTNSFSWTRDCIV